MIEILESRIAPAVLNAAGNLLTYTDIDGDLVHVAFTHATVAAEDFLFNGNQFLNGDTTTPQFLVEIQLAGKTGANVTLTATPQRGHGDSHADVGIISAADTDLGTIGIDGDVENLSAGSGSAGTIGLKSFTALSLNRHGSTEGAVTLKNPGAVKIRTDVQNETLNVSGGIKSLSIGGNFEETIDGDSTTLNLSGNSGTVTIGGSIIGRSGTAEMITSNGPITSLSIGGSVLGGSAALTTASGTPHQIHLLGLVKTLSIGGDLVGGNGADGASLAVNQVGLLKIGGSIVAGTGGASGAVFTGPATSVTVGGSIVGTGSAFGAAFLQIDGAVGAVKIGGSIIGGGASQTGALQVDGNATSITIGKSIIGGDSIGSNAVAESGTIASFGNIGTLTIGGSLIAGRVEGTGTLTKDGEIAINGAVGAIKIGGGIFGDVKHAAYIMAGGTGTTGTVDAIKSLSVKGSMQNGSIVTGYNLDLSAGNTDSGIGSVAIGGDLAASYITIGASKGLDGIPGNSDDVALSTTAVLRSVKVGGAFEGLAGSPTQFYIFGPIIEKLEIGHASYTHAQTQNSGANFSGIGNAIAQSAD